MIKNDNTRIDLCIKIETGAKMTAVSYEKWVPISARCIIVQEEVNRALIEMPGSINGWINLDDLDTPVSILNHGKLEPIIIKIRKSALISMITSF